MTGFGGIPGRNKFKKICFKCGVMVPANEGYLKKHGDKYVVKCLKECKPDFDEKAFLSKKEEVADTKPKVTATKRNKNDSLETILERILKELQSINEKLNK